jgi:ATP-dependent helicase HepA
MKNTAIPAGSWFLELDFTNTVTAPAKTAAQEFCPQGNLRLLLDSQGRELSDKVSRELLDQQASFLDKKTARQILKQLRGPAQDLIHGAQDQARSWQERLVKAQQEKISETLQRELKRLEALKDVNPSVRESEIEALKERQATLLAATEQPQLSLTAIRILVNNH